MHWQTYPSPPTNGLPPRLPAQRNLLTSVDDVRTAATVVAASAQRVLTIMTHELESPVFEYAPFLEAVKRLVLARRFAKVRVLLLNPTRVPHHRHAFVALARKLTSHIEIRSATDEFRDVPDTYIVADGHATLYRLQTTRWEGICDLQDRGVARSFLERFDVAWLASGTPRTQVALKV